MKKIHILGAAFFAVLAFSAIAVASASAAEPVWENKETKSVVTTNVAAKTDGLLQLHQKKISPFEGGGELTVHCEGSFDGTVGAKGADLVEKVLSKAGVEVTEAKPLECTVEKSTNFVCVNGAKATVFADNLSWKTQLTGVLGGTVFDDFETEKAGATTVGYSATCAGVTVLCSVKLDRAKFDENLANGALFLFLGELVATCSNGAEGTVLGMGEVLGFNVV